jgi:hypothetical protein
VLVDAGGPGLSIFGEQWPQVLEQELTPALPGSTLVLLEEPWVRADLSPGCDETLRTNFRAVHAGTPSDPSALAVGCDLGGGRWGWTPATYRAAVRQVAAAENLTFEGYVGVSFGAQRLRYLPDVFRWAVVANPAPATSTGAEYLETRARGVEQMLATLCPCSPGEVADQLAATAATASAAPAETDGRSVPVTGADVGAAALALSYQSDDVRAAGAASLLGRVDDASIVGALADRTWMRFGADDISPAYLAYLDEVCAAFGPWPAPGSVQGGPVVQALVSLHAPCAGVLSDGAPVALPTDLDVCVSDTPDDPVAPPSFGATWTALGAHHESVPGTSHADLHGIAACLTYLGATGSARS